MANPQYIYTMANLRKVVPPSREILKGIYLAFFPGAKIGVLGLNAPGIIVRAPRFARSTTGGVGGKFVRLWPILNTSIRWRISGRSSRPAGRS